MEGPVIEIRRDGAGLVVDVVPPQPGFPVERFDCPRRARGAAGGLRLTQGWPKRDLLGDV